MTSKGLRFFNYTCFLLSAGESLVRHFDSPHLRLQLDIFHLQFLRGDLTHSIDRFLPITGEQGFFLLYIQSDFFERFERSRYSSEN